MIFIADVNERRVQSGQIHDRSGGGRREEERKKKAGGWGTNRTTEATVRQEIHGQNGSVGKGSWKDGSEAPGLQGLG